MNRKLRIIIGGIGGVGGYIGGSLALHYHKHPDIEIIFIARGLNETAIKKNGLKLITSNCESICYPGKITHEPNEAGKADLLICCVKNFDLEETLKSLKSCITNDTIILPFQNGLDASEKIRIWYPNTEVWNGCIYLVSRLIGPGVVKQNGKLNQIYFGANASVPNKTSLVENIFKEAGLQAKSSNDILLRMWEKFFFISTVATVTSYYHISVGELLEIDHYSATLMGLMQELKSIANQQGICLSNKIFQEIFDKVASMPYDSTSSMQDDFKAGNKTEVDSLTGYVIELGKRSKTPTPLYNQMFIELNNRLIHPTNNI